MKEIDNYIKLFTNFLAGFGGHLPIVDTKSEKKEHGDGRRGVHRRPLNRDNYITGPSGSLRRRYPKRDKTMSARQWKKTVKAARREAKANVQG